MTPRNRKRRPPTLAVYVELLYWRDGNGFSTDQPFMLFVFALRPYFDRIILIGRREPTPGRAPYAIPEDIEVAGLPYYRSLHDTVGILRQTPATLREIWRALAPADVVWVLGPHPMSIPTALAALARRKRVVLGVRQNFPDYVRFRLHGGGLRPAWLTAVGLEAVFRLLARRLPIVAVGPDLAGRFRARGRTVLELEVSLVPAALPRPRRPRDAHETQVARLISVGRLDPEKTPELLLELIEILRSRGTPTELLVVGSGPLEGQLRAAATPFGDAVRVLGHVPHGPELYELYAGADVFVHVARTEGLPQVLVEAQASGVPVVATDVGGVREALGDSALIVPAGDARLLADAVERVVHDSSLAKRLALAGRRRAHGRTREAQAALLAEFILGALDPGDASPRGRGGT